MNVLIICANGISSGILAKKIEDELKLKESSSTCIAASQLDLDEMIEGKDYILVGPQLRIMFETLKNRVNGRVPISLIESVDYGQMNAKNIVKKIYKNIAE